MLNPQEHFFPHRPKRLRNIPGFDHPTEALSLLEDQQLSQILGEVEHLPQSACYPHQVAFYEKLLHCDLLLPIPVSADLNRGLPLLSLENGNGETGLPIFTNENNLAQWTQGQNNYLPLSFTKLCAYALEARMDYLILNIAGPFGCEISFHDFSYLAEGLIPPPGPGQTTLTTNVKPGEVMIAKHTPMRLSECDSLPTPLMNRLQQVFRHHEDMIESVYLFDIAFNEGPMQPALGVRMPEILEPLWEATLWPNLQAVLHEMLERHAVVNVFLLNQAGNLETHLQDLTQPVYRK